MMHELSHDSTPGPGCSMQALWRAGPDVSVALDSKARHIDSTRTPVTQFTPGQGSCMHVRFWPGLVLT